MLRFFGWLLSIVTAAFVRPARRLAEALPAFPTDDEVAAQVLAVPCHMAIGLGADFAMSTDGGSTYNSLGHIVDVIDGPEAEAEDKDVSYLQQPDASMRFAAGLINEGECKIKIFWSASNFATARAQIRTANYWKVTWNDKVSATNSTLVFQGFLKRLGNSVPLKDNMITDLTVKVSGPPTFTQAT